MSDVPLGSTSAFTSAPCFLSRLTALRSGAMMALRT